MESFDQQNELPEEKSEHSLRERVNEVNDRVSDRVNEELHAVRDALHRRPDKGGDWDAVAPADRNIHQRIAARTWGIATVANLVTATGVLLTLSGMRDYERGNYKKATIKMGFGRGLDMVDGALATKLGTRSATGALFDAGGDKALAAVFIVKAVKNGDMPPAEAVVHGLQQARISRESLLIKNAGGEPNPSKEGKHGMAALWLRAGGIVLSGAFRKAEHEDAALVTDALSLGAQFGAMHLNHTAGLAYNADRRALEAAKASQSKQ